MVSHTSFPSARDMLRRKIEDDARIADAPTLDAAVMWSQELEAAGQGMWLPLFLLEVWQQIRKGKGNGTEAKDNA